MTGMPSGRSTEASCSVSVVLSTVCGFIGLQAIGESRPLFPGRGYSMKARTSARTAARKNLFR